MAISLEQVRDKILTSIYGRRLGLDKDDYLCGFKSQRVAVSNATSDTTGTALAPYGVHTVTTTTDDGWRLTDPPAPGVVVRIATGSSSTGLHAVTPVAATIISSNGVAGSSMTLAGAGAYIELTSITTAQWIVTSIMRTTTGVTTTPYVTVSS